MATKAKTDEIKLNKEELASLVVESTKNTLTNEELMELVNETFDKVLTKSAMLKTLRAAGYSVAQNRCYNAYLQIEKVRVAKEKTNEPKK